MPLPLKQYPRWLLEEHDISSLFNSLLSTGKAVEVSARIQREPKHMQAIMDLLGSADTKLSSLIGIGVVMEDFAGTPLLQQYTSQLGKLTRHHKSQIRADACHYLGLGGSPDALPYLQAALQDADSEVREVAADALAILSKQD